MNFSRSICAWATRTLYTKQAFGRRRRGQLTTGGAANEILITKFVSSHPHISKRSALAGSRQSKIGNNERVAEPFCSGTSKCCISFLESVQKKKRKKKPLSHMHCRECFHIYTCSKQQNLWSMFFFPPLYFYTWICATASKVWVDTNTDFWVFPHAAAPIQSHIQCYSACVKEDAKSDQFSDQYQWKLCHKIQSVAKYLRCTSQPSSPVEGKCFRNQEVV